MKLLDFVLIVWIIFVSIFIITNDKANCNEDIQIIKSTFPVQIDSTLTKENVILFLLEINIKYPEIVYAKIMLETGNLSSQICRENNNLFGMKTIGNRPTTNKGSKNGYAYFESWKDSIIDYLLYQSLYLKNKSKEEYYNYLLNTYSQDSNYIYKIKELEESYYIIKETYDNNR